MAGNSQRRGAVRKTGSKKGATAGSGGQRRKGLEGKDPTKKLWGLAAAEPLVRGIFQLYAKAVGLHGYHLPNMDEIAALAKDH